MSGLNILQITPSYKPAYIYGGPIVSISLLCENLIVNNRVTVYTTLANGSVELEYESNQFQNIDAVDVCFFKRITKDHSHLSITLLMAVWRNCQKFDVVHIHSWWNAVAVFSALICRIKGVNYVISPRGMFSEYSQSNGNTIVKKSVNFLFKKLLLNNQSFHATANKEFIQIKNLIKGARISVIPNFVKIQKNYFIKKRKNSVFQLVFLSRIDSKKGILLLFEAMANITFQIELVIVGNGNMEYIEELKKMTEAIGLKDKISWKGSVFSDEKYQLLVNADLFVLPSSDENFANAVIESLSVGTPVIVSNQVGLADFVSEYNLGWVCDLNSKSLHDAILKSFEDIEKRKAINLAAPRIIEEVFSTEKINKMYIAMYQNVILNE